MEQKEMIRDDRPAFEALAGKQPEELFGTLPTPCYLIDEGQLKKNGEILAAVAKHTGCRILLAQKAFSNYDCYPVLAPFLSGTEASGLYEARLGAEQMPGREGRRKKSGAADQSGVFDTGRPCDLRSVRAGQPARNHQGAVER